MKPIVSTIIAVAIAAGVTTSTQADEAHQQGTDTQTNSEAMKATRTHKEIRMPRRHVKLVRHFTPDATPTPSYVKSVVIASEAARWGVNYWSLYNRISCETGGKFNYWADNATSDAAGLGQFMPETWSRALEVWPRAVRLVKRTTALIHRKVIIHYSDGSARVVRGRLVRRAVTIVRRGMLPRWPSVYHGWASVRGTARAIAGLGHVGAGEWSCGT